MNTQESVLMTQPEDISKYIYLNESFTWTGDMIQNISMNRDILNSILFDDTVSIKKFFQYHDKKFKNFISSRKSINWDDIDEQAIEMMNGGITALTLFDEDYPSRLKQISDPPLILYHIGSLFDFNNCIAISGTRRSCDHIIEMTYEIARELTKKGYTIASGLAEGVDTAAHEGALSIENGATIAVMANGLKKVFPKKNIELAKRIAERGAVLSEKTLRPDPLRYDFIRRNRIISGISNVLIIMQSSGKGGTKHQFDLARKQGRPILVLEDNELPAESIMSHSSMISSGSKGFTSVKEALDLVDKLSVMGGSSAVRENLSIDMWA